MLWKLAWRNIWRNRTQSLVMMAAIGIGVLASLCLVSFYYGMVEQRIQSVINRETGHIQVHHPAFREDPDAKYGIPGSGRLLDSLAVNPELKAFGPRIVLQGMAATAAGNVGVRIMGVVPDSERKLTGLDEKIVAGGYFENGKRNPLVISERLVKKLKVKLGSKVVMTFQNASGDVISMACKITGVFRTNSKPYDLQHVFLRNEDIVRECGDSTGINEIAMLLHRSGAVDGQRARLQASFPDTRVETWQEISPEMRLLVSSFQEYMFIYMGIILFALAFGITNTMQMSVVKRTREFGMLLAFGMNKRKVFGMVMLETAFLVFSAVPVGLSLALAVIAFFHRRGINMENTRATMESFGFDMVIYPAITWQHIQDLLVLITLIIFISALGPARRALSYKPVEALRKI